MTYQRTHGRSPYMEYAKLHSSAKYNLAGSGMASFPLSELGISISDLEINGPTYYGYQPLNRAVSQRYRVPEECVVLANGTAMANHLALTACAEPGDEVLIEEPTYPLLLDTAQYLGFQVKRFKRKADDFQIDLADFHQQISDRTKLVVICNLHNPSGVLTPESTLCDIGETAKRVGARVMVDEVYLEMMWQSQPVSAFHLDQETFVSTNSLTKAYGLSGLRCGWILAAPELAHRMWRINDLYGATPVHPAELMSVVAFAKLEMIAQKQKTVLETNRRLLKEFMESQCAMDYVWPEHGTVIAPRLKQGAADAFCARLRNDFQVGVVPGTFFGMPHHIRMGVGGQTEDVRAALQQFSKALNT